MNLGEIPLIGMLQQKMSWLNSRQDVLARNIANASTPGFVPKDLRAGDFASALSKSMQGSMIVTSPLHMNPLGSAGAHRAVDTPDSQASPDGNAVVVEEQMIKVADTQLDYAQVAGLYKKMTSMWRTALGGQG
jgi:flagellar basal-body rod protein FlgB